MAGSTDILMAWTGTAALVMLFGGLWRAQNHKTRTVVSALAFLFWMVFTFSSYGVFISAVNDRERLTLFAALGVVLTLTSFVILVYNAIHVIGEMVDEDTSREGMRRADL